MIHIQMEIVMPHLRFRGIERDPVARLSGSLIQKLSALTGAPAAHFTIERVDRVHYRRGDGGGLSLRGADVV